MSAASLKLALRYFGDYVLLDEIARGGMGVVYHARQISLDREVAVKMIHAGALTGPSLAQRFRTEAQAMAQLDHPHIVPIYEVGEHEGQHYLAMKLAEANLAECLMVRHGLAIAPSGPGGQKNIVSDSGRMAGPSAPESTTDIALFTAKIARAVHHAHQRGVIHRDLKPGNILIDQQGEPLVADFGLAKIMDSEMALTQSAATMGTPHYMPPEQAMGKSAQITTAADIYSLGAVLFELLTGRPPFVADTRDAVVQKVIHDASPWPQALNPSIPRDLETISLKCLEKDPQRRYRTAEELADDLEAWREGRPIEARPAALWEQIYKWIRRKPAFAALIAIGCLGLAGIFWQWRQAEHARRAADDSLAQLRAAVTQYLSVIASSSRNKPSDPAFFREELFQVSVSFLENFTRFRAADPTLDRQRGLAYVGLGRVQNERGFRESAITNAMQGRKILETLSATDAQSLTLKSDLANANLVLGGILIRSTNQVDAEAYLRRALQGWQDLTNRPGVSANARRQLANTCNRLCDLYRRINRPDDAIEVQRRGLIVREGLVAEFPRAWDEKLNTAIDCNSLALALATGPAANAGEASELIASRSSRLTSDPQRLSESFSVYLKAIKLYDELVHERPKDEATRSSLAICAWTFGNLLGATANTNQAIAYLGKALTNYQELAVQFPLKTNYVREVQNTQGKIERLLPQIGNPNE